MTLKRRLAKWVRLGGRPRRFSYKRALHLHAYEEKVILHDAATFTVGDGKAQSFSQADLMDRFPGRYNQRYLKIALERMRKSGKLAGRGGYRFFGGMYRLPDTQPQQEAA